MFIQQTEYYMLVDMHFTFSCWTLQEKIHVHARAFNILHLISSLNKRKKEDYYSYVSFINVAYLRPLSS